MEMMTGLAGAGPVRASPGVAHAAGHGAAGDPTWGGWQLTPGLADLRHTVDPAHRCRAYGCRYHRRCHQRYIQRSRQPRRPCATMSCGQRPARGRGPAQGRGRVRARRQPATSALSSVSRSAEPPSFPPLPPFLRYAIRSSPISGTTSGSMCGMRLSMTRGIMSGICSAM